EAFDFKIFDDPNKMYKAIVQKNEQGKNARLLAGYAWPWSSEKEGNRDAEISDIKITEKNFEMPWNSWKNSETWAIDKDKVVQIRIIHTSQGLVFDYVGVIVGNDMKFNPETMEIYSDYNEYYDRVGKQGLKNQPAELTKLIKNIYKVLM